MAEGPTVNIRDGGNVATLFFPWVSCQTVEWSHHSGAVEHGTPDPRQLADDQDIIGPEPIQYSRDLSVAPGCSTGRRFLDKFDTTEILLVGEGKDFGADIYAVSIGYRESYGRFGTFAPLEPTIRSD